MQEFRKYSQTSYLHINLILVANYCTSRFQIFTSYFFDIHFITILSSTLSYSKSVAYPGILFGGGGSTNSVEDGGQREWGSGGSSPLVRGSGGSCNLVQEIFISYSKIFLIFGTLRLFMMTTNLFVIANVKKL